MVERPHAVGTIMINGVTYEIIAVVGDAKYLELREKVPPTLYLHGFQHDAVPGQFAIRTAGSSLSVS